MRDAIQDSGKVAIAKAIMRDHEYIGVIRTYEDALLFNTIHYAEEIRSLEDFDIPSSKVTAPKSEMALAKQLISSMSGPFKHSKFVNEYKEDVEELLEKKAKGKTVKVVEKEPKKSASNVYDLTSWLKQSIKKSKHTGQEPKKKKKRA